MSESNVSHDDDAAVAAAIGRAAHALSHASSEKQALANPTESGAQVAAALSEAALGGRRHKV